MNECVKISIIVPIYNSEKYLQRCIDSILSQTFNDYELILINDGSSDNSGNICDKYEKEDHRIKVFHKENGGVSSARNLGIDNAKGEWVAFIDSDDQLDRDYLLNFNLNSDADLLVQGYKKEYFNKKPEMIIPNMEESYLASDVISIIFDLEKKSIINSPWCKLFKREILFKHNILFDNNISYGEDHLFSLSFIEHIATISVTPKAGYIYQIRASQSLSTKCIEPEKLIYYADKVKEIRYNLYKKIINPIRQKKYRDYTNYQYICLYLLSIIHLYNGIARRANRVLYIKNIILTNKNLTQETVKLNHTFMMILMILKMKKSLELKDFLLKIFLNTRAIILKISHS